MRHHRLFSIVSGNSLNIAAIQHAVGLCRGLAGQFGRTVVLQAGIGVAQSAQPSLDFNGVPKRKKEPQLEVCIESSSKLFTGVCSWNGLTGRRHRFELPTAARTLMRFQRPCYLQTAATRKKCTPILFDHLDKRDNPKLYVAALYFPRVVAHWREFLAISAVA